MVLAKQMLLSQWKECIISRWWWGYPSTHSNAQGCFPPSLRSQKDQKSHTLCLSVKYWVSEHTCNHFSLRMKVVCYSFLMNLDIWALLNSWPFLVPHLKTTCSLSKPRKFTGVKTCSAFIYSWIQKIWIWFSKYVLDANNVIGTDLMLGIVK